MNLKKVKAFEADYSFFLIVKEGPNFKVQNMTCQHRGGPLVFGKENGASIICPWHNVSYKKERICKYKTKLPYVMIGSELLLVFENNFKVIKKNICTWKN